MNRLFADAIFWLQVMILPLFMFYEHMLPQAVRENKVTAFFGAFIAGNVLSSALTKSNAFEIYVGSKLIWSQLQEGRQLNRMDLIRSFASVNVQLDI